MGTEIGLKSVHSYKLSLVGMLPSPRGAESLRARFNLKVKSCNPYSQCHGWHVLPNSGTGIRDARTHGTRLPISIIPIPRVWLSLSYRGIFSCLRASAAHGTKGRVCPSLSDISIVHTGQIRDVRAGFGNKRSQMRSLGIRHYLSIESAARRNLRRSPEKIYKENPSQKRSRNQHWKQE